MCKDCYQPITGSQYACSTQAIQLGGMTESTKAIMSAPSHCHRLWQRSFVAAMVSNRIEGVLAAPWRARCLANPARGCKPVPFSETTRLPAPHAGVPPACFSSTRRCKSLIAVDAFFRVTAGGVGIWLPAIKRSRPGCSCNRPVSRNDRTNQGDTISAANAPTQTGRPTISGIVPC
jgi:hypothetical protein